MVYYKSVSAIAGGGKTAVLLNTFSKGLARCSGSNWVFFPDPNWLCAPGANSDIAYQRWTQPLVSEDTDFEDDSQNALLKKFSDVFCIDMEPDQSVYLWWFDEIEDKNLLNKLLKLSVEDLELLDQLAFQELTQKEICSRTKKTQSSISQRIKTIRKKLRNSQ